MRYFFHLRIGATLSVDEIGLDLPDVETAYLEAFKAAQEMSRLAQSLKTELKKRRVLTADLRGEIGLARQAIETARSTLQDLHAAVRAPVKKPASTHTFHEPLDQSSPLPVPVRDPKRAQRRWRMLSSAIV
jgi:hypothetical protein